MLRRVGWFLLVAFAFPVAAIAQSRSLFTPEDVFRLRSVGEVRISPDGRAVAYEAFDTDVMIDGRRRSLRIIEIASGNDRLVADGAGTPRWSPDGRSIAYIDREGRIVVAAADGAGARIVASPASAPGSFAWSPDATRIAFVRFVPEPSAPTTQAVAKPAGANWAPPPRVITGVRYDEDGQGPATPGHSQLFVVPIAGGEPTQLTGGDSDVFGDPVWLPDGRAIVYGTIDLDRLGPDLRRGRLLRVDAAGGGPVVLTSAGIAAGGPAVSPDGRSIAFTAFAADGRDYAPSRLWVMDADGANARIVERNSDRDVFGVQWSADGRYLYARYVDRSIDKLRRVAPNGSGARDVAANIAGDASISGAGAIAYATYAPDRPAEVAFIPATGGAQRLLTGRNAALLANKALGQTVALPVRSSLDGASVGAWLTRPARFVAGRRYPLILDIHGGPYGYDEPAWRTRDQLYAAAGYAVLHVNYRGSTSYGLAFSERIAKDPLPAGMADLLSAVDAAIADGVADSRRLFVTGGSAGGELTAWIVGHTDRFRAAMAEKPVINGLSKALASDQYYALALVAGPKPWEDPMRYWHDSPLSAVANVTTPTMLVVGEEDRRTPPGEAQQFYDALTLRGVPTALVLVPGASHSSLGARPSQLNAIIQLTLDWFARFDRPGGQVVTAPKR